MQSTIASTASNLVYTQNDLTALTTFVDTKADISSLLTASDLIDTKASIVALSGINSTLTSQLNTLSSLMGTRASVTSLSEGLATKQDVLGNSLTLSDLQIIGSSDVGVIKHNNGLAFQTNDGLLTYAMF